MFSVIINIYNKKTKGPTLMELYTDTGKLKKFFLSTRHVRCVHHGWHGTHRYDIQVLATHASTWVHRYSLLLQWSVILGQRGHPVSVNCLYHARMVLSVGGVLCVLCTKCTLHSNHRITRVIFRHTKTTSPPERPFSHYIHSHRLVAEMWTTMKNNFLGKTFLSSFYLEPTGFVNTCPSVLLSWIFVIVEYIMKRPVFNFNMTSVLRYGEGLH
jgi:hypothetical protein